MISRLVEFTLKNRFMVLALTLLLLVWGAISFHNLPVEAYPDVANNYVQVITQWPGRAAEEVEQQVTIPIETQLNGLPHMQNLRSASLFGLSSVTMIFDDNSEDDWNRQKVLERISLVSLPNNLQPSNPSRTGRSRNNSNLCQTSWMSLVLAVSLVNIRSRSILPA
jgi:cobalt-zinc-cadmium resistance protein CzcA